MSELAIDVTQLSKKFSGKFAVENISLGVNRGEIFGFLGPNGSGKTTMIRMLCGLMKPDAGAGQCLGFDIINQSEWIKPLVGYVPQAFSLYKDLTVKENLEFIAHAYNIKEYVIPLKNIMNDLELGRYAKTLAGNLSGGWKQRLSLAAALIHQPKLLLLDEPTAGVDPKTRREFWHYISYLTTEGVTVLVSTHYMDEAERCNHLAYVVYGQLMIEGTIPEIIKKVGLFTFIARGDGLKHLAKEMQIQPGITQVIPWGNELRVCGSDKMLMQQNIAKYPSFHWESVDSSLEEVFIHLVNERELKPYAG